MTLKEAIAISLFVIWMVMCFGFLFVAIEAYGGGFIVAMVCLAVIVAGLIWLVYVVIMKTRGN